MNEGSGDCQVFRSSRVSLLRFVGPLVPRSNLWLSGKQKSSSEVVNQNMEPSGGAGMFFRLA